MIASDYLDRVAWELRDLPWGMRQQLLADLREHLAELPPETGLVEIGTPEQYAAELREAARLERRRGPIAFLRARRPRNLVLLVLVLVVVGLVIGAVEWIDSYQPLTFGNGFQMPGARQPDDSNLVVFRQGAPFELGVSIVNRGRFAVRILGAPFAPGEPWRARLLMLPPQPDNGGYAGQLSPFHPFELQPGQATMLYARGHLHTQCSSWSPGGSMGLADFPVRFGFLWRTSTVELPLPQPVTFVFRKGSCP